MAFDGLMLAAVVGEFQKALLPGRVNRVYQPSDWELVLHVYAGGRERRLLVSVHPQWARIHLTRLPTENPGTPPAFCMLLRKHLEGARLLGIEQPDWERLCRLRFGAVDELGLPAERVLVAEVMGQHSNVVLLDGQGKILDAMRRVSLTRNPYREVLPGRAYVPPPSQHKLDPLDRDLANRFREDWQPQREGADPLWQVLQRRLAGFSPDSAREAALRAGQDPRAAAGGADLDACLREAAALAQKAASEPEPCAYLAPDGRVAAYAPFPLHQDPGLEVRPYPGTGDLLDEIWHHAAIRERFERLRDSLRRTLTRELARNRKKLALQAEALREAAGADRLRLLGELLTSYRHLVPPGATLVRLPNYHDPAGAEVEVPLQSDWSPIQNAQAYFRQYQKARATLAGAREHYDRTREEIRYLEQVEATLDLVASLPELQEIHRELAEGGYLRVRAKPRAAGGGGTRRGGGREKGAAGAPASEPLRHRSSDGLAILVGKNNRQNDLLTLKQAGPDDLWLHTKEIPGSHVILQLPPGRGPEDLPPRSLREAALLAAYHSKARQSSQVPVDYTLRRHVRKPPGAKPGMVIYDHHHTIYVTPSEAVVPPREGPVVTPATPPPSPAGPAGSPGRGQRPR